jgi:hypothetical protein
VITDDVPAGALALGRGRQIVKENWTPGGAKTSSTKPKAKAALRKKAKKKSKSKTKR